MPTRAKRPRPNQPHPRRQALTAANPQDHVSQQQRKNEKPKPFLRHKSSVEPTETMQKTQEPLSHLPDNRREATTGRSSQTQGGPMVRNALTLVALLFAVHASAQVAGYERSRGGILMPRAQIQAGSFSEFSNFDSDFCGQNEVAGSPVKQLCFGRMRLQSQAALSARAFLATDANGIKALYVENEMPKVELKSTEFAILGPLNGAKLGVAAEVGRVRLSIDFRGEVSGVELVTKNLGRMKITRP